MTKRILIVDDIRSDFDIMPEMKAEGSNLLYASLEDDMPRDDIVICRSYEMGKVCLEKFKWDELYLDNDLGGERQGYELMVFLENNLNLLPREIFFVTANPSAKVKMIACYEAIKKRVAIIDLKNANDFCIVDKEDEEKLNQYSWYKNDAGYALNKSGKIAIRMHRLLMNCTNDMVVDHINRNKLDNRKENLRIVTQSNNGKNLTKTSSNTTSKYKGVCWYKRDKKWRAYIVLNNKQVHLGYFDNQISAAEAYNHKAKELFKEFANLNVIKDEDRIKDPNFNKGYSE